MPQKTENRMAHNKWGKMLSDLQQKVRYAKGVGPDAREGLMETLASVVYVIQRTRPRSLVRRPRGVKLVPSVTWVAEEQVRAALQDR